MNLGVRLETKKTKPSNWHIFMNSDCKLQGIAMNYKTVQISDEVFLDFTGFGKRLLTGDIVANA